MTPNVTQILSLVRVILVALGGMLVSKGYFTTAQAATFTDNLLQVIGALLILGPLVWALIVHTKAATVARAADIVAIPVSEQFKAGVLNPQATPTNPKQP